MTILKEAVLAVTDRRKDYEEADAYYEGDVPEVFATAGLRRAMRKTGYTSRLNFCRPVVDAVQNRLEISKIVAGTAAAQKVIDDTWTQNELHLDSNEIHRWSLVYGDCYVMVWPDENGDLEVSYNTPLTTAIVYDPEHPRKKDYAVKLWETEDGARLNLYYPDAIYKYEAKGSAITEGSRWSLIDTVENPFGEVPVFHFRTMRPFGRPEHKDGYDAQNYINKQFIQSMITADYQSAPQRYALSKVEGTAEIEDFNEGDTDRENLGALSNGPGELWYLKGVDSVGEFQPADPAVFWQPIKDTIRSMASLTNTPLHYFEKTGNVPSGEALRVAEAPLIKKVDDRKASFGQAWRDLFLFVLKVNNIKTEVTVKWKEIESLDELERLDAALKKRNEGLSLQQVMREQGYAEDVIARVIEEAKQERELGLVANANGSPITANTAPTVRATVTDGGNNNG